MAIGLFRDCRLFKALYNPFRSRPFMYTFLHYWQRLAGAVVIQTHTLRQQWICLWGQFGVQYTLTNHLSSDQRTRLLYLQRPPKRLSSYLPSSQLSIVKWLIFHSDAATMAGQGWLQYNELKIKSSQHIEIRRRGRRSSSEQEWLEWNDENKCAGEFGPIK